MNKMHCPDVLHNTHNRKKTFLIIFKLQCSHNFRGSRISHKIREIDYCSLDP